MKTSHECSGGVLHRTNPVWFWFWDVCVPKSSISLDRNQACTRKPENCQLFQLGTALDFQSPIFGFEGDPRLMSMDELKELNTQYGFVLNGSNRRKFVHKLISRMLVPPICSSIESFSFVYVSPEFPFTVEVMRTGKIVMEFSVQRYSRPNCDAEWVYSNAQLVEDE